MIEHSHFAFTTYDVLTYIVSRFNEKGARDYLWGDNIDTLLASAAPYMPPCIFPDTYFDIPLIGSDSTSLRLAWDARDYCREVYEQGLTGAAPTWPVGFPDKKRARKSPFSFISCVRISKTRLLSHWWAMGRYVQAQLSEPSSAHSK